MYQTKAKIYLNLDKTQKSAICNYLRAFVKQNIKLTCSEILDKFFDNEKYYLEMNTSRFPFLLDNMESEDFYRNTLLYISVCKQYYEYKESQRPIIEKQKQFEKQKRKFLQEIKMSKEKPTSKQLYYYDKLCKKYKLTPKCIEKLSKLEIRNEIERIINEHQTINR